MCVYPLFKGFKEVDLESFQLGGIGNFVTRPEPGPVARAPRPSSSTAASPSWTTLGAKRKTFERKDKEKRRKRRELI